MLLYHISQKENKFTVYHLQAEDLSKHRLFKPGIKTRGMAAWQWKGDKVHLQQQRCVLKPEHYYVTINTWKYTPSSKKYPCLTLSQAISQLFNQSNNQLIIHQSIYQSDNYFSQSVSPSVIEAVSQLSLNHSVSFLSTCISLSTFKSVSESHCQPVNPTGILSVFLSTMQSDKQLVNQSINQSVSLWMKLSVSFN